MMTLSNGGSITKTTMKNIISGSDDEIGHYFGLEASSNSIYIVNSNNVYNSKKNELYCG